MELNEIRKKLKKELDKGRYEHTKGVMYTAGCLAWHMSIPWKRQCLQDYFMTVQSVSQMIRK